MTHARIAHALGVIPGLAAVGVLLASAASLGQDAGEIAWGDDFEQGELRAWQPYGDGCTIKIDTETPHSGEHALRAGFDDLSGLPWANRGVRIAFEQGLAWEQFSYVFLYYHLDRPANALGYFLHDADGNWWRATTETPVVGQWAPAAMSAGGFGFGWNDDPNMPPGTKDSAIVELFIYVSTLEANTGARYTLAVDDIALCAALPEGVMATVVEPPPPPLSMPPEEGEPFPLQWRVNQMDDRGYLLVGGEPFFPLGLYSCIGIDQASGAHGTCRYTGPVTDEKVDYWLRAVKDAGFNLLQTYTMQFYGMEIKPGVMGDWQMADVVRPTTPEKLVEGSLKLLDLCHNHGLKLMLGSAHPYSTVTLPEDPERRAEELEGWREKVRANVLACKAHPALLVWYLTDEPSTVPFSVADLTEQYRYLKELDSDHALLISSAAVTDVQYARAVDIIAPDPYPIETGVPLRAIPRRVRPLKDIAVGTPPMPQTWAVIQACQWVEGRRLPSEQEMRLMALTALSQSATGLLFYEFKNYPDHQPAHWESVGRVVRSLQSVIPALLAPGRSQLDVPSSDPRVHSLAKQVGEAAGAEIWIIATNPSENLADEPMGLGEVTFSLAHLNIPDGATAVAVDEAETGQFQPGSSRPVTLELSDESYRLVDDFGPLASHVYRIALP